MALKVQYTVKRDANVLGILRWKKHGTIGVKGDTILELLDFNCEGVII